MKKLMIAAAAAAMIGGAQAQFAYDFVANLKTTTSKQSTTTITKNYGKIPGTTTYWYEDAVFGPSSTGAANYRDYNASSGNVYANALYINPRTKVGTLKLTDNEGKTELAADLDLGGYTAQDQNKWCLTFKYTESGCFRVAGSRRLTTSYTIADCCGSTKFDGPTADENLIVSILYRFGNLNFAQATKVEFLGYIGKPSFAKRQISTPAAYAIGGAMPAVTPQPTLHLAGQGTWATLRAADRTTKAGISSISGNVVGILPCAKCDICCGQKDWDLVYLCDGTDNSAAEVGGVYTYEDTTGVTDLDGWETVAFGTFTLKFNARNSTL